MSDKTKVKISMEEAIVNALWMRGLITNKEREEMKENSRKKLQKIIAT